MSITVYTLPQCSQCEQTKRFFNKNSIEYSVVDISKDEDARKTVTDMGFSSAPIVVTDHDRWSGFRLEKLNKTVESYAS